MREASTASLALTAKTRFGPTARALVSFAAQGHQGISHALGVTSPPTTYQVVSRSEGPEAKGTVVRTLGERMHVDSLNLRSGSIPRKLQRQSTFSR